MVLRKNAAKTITFRSPHQHWVAKPAIAAVRYWSISKKRILKTARYGDIRLQIDVPRIDFLSLRRAVQIIKARDHFLDSRLLDADVHQRMLGGDSFDQLRNRYRARFE